MNKQDPALNFDNSRLLAAIYYGLLSVVGTILIDGFLTSIGYAEIVPLFEAIILGMVIASITGAIFGKSIIHCPKPYKLRTFLLGFIMVLLSLPFFVFGLIFFMYQQEKPILAISNTYDFITSFLIMLGYSYILFGFLLALAAGFASIYLRGVFIYQVLQTDTRDSQSLPRYTKRPVKTKSKSKTKTTTIQKKNHKKVL